MCTKTVARIFYRLTLILTPVCTFSSPISLEESSRFLSQAATGADYEMIEHLSNIGYEAWYQQQTNLPINLLRPLAESIIEEHGTDENELEFSNIPFRYVLWNQLLGGEDILRQRVVLALSEILVISDYGSDLVGSSIGLADYYDMLSRHAFGNYRDLLIELTYNPCMGYYLSHAGNQLADADLNRFPDENYAREIMQLFSIGLYELNMDGSKKLDAAGRPIPTYDNNTITEFAEIFTGIIYDYRDELEDRNWIKANDERLFRELKRREFQDFEEPMIGVESQHDKSDKHLLKGTVLPGGQSIREDVEGAIENLLNHPSTAPFISRQLIQRLVMSNPSPAYIERVANVFANNGAGVTGDLKSVIRAILFDPEARSFWDTNPSRGKLREPFLRMIKILRGFNSSNINGEYWNITWWEGEALKQRPFSSPSVFNFFLPDYSPKGTMTQNGLVGPEFQITDTQSIPSTVDLFMYMIFYSKWKDEDEDDTSRNSADVFNANAHKPWHLDLSDELQLANQPEALIDRLALILCGGQLSQETKQILLDLYDSTWDDPDYQVRLLLWAISISPEYVIQP